MRDASLLQLAVDGHCGRYRVQLLADPAPCERGITHGEPAHPRVLEWSAIRWVVAAEVGEPEGVRTVIFDLVLDGASAARRGTYEVRRLDAEPGSEAMQWAAAIEAAVAPERCAPSVKALAAEGTPSRWYQNLEEFEAAALELLDA